MLMPTFLQMSQRYVPVTVEWQWGGKKIKRNTKKMESNAQKNIISIQAAITHVESTTRRKKKKQFENNSQEKRGWGAFLKVVPTWHCRQPASQSLELSRKSPERLRSYLRPCRAVSRQKSYTKRMAESSGSVINMSESITAAEGSALGSTGARH